MDRQTRELCAKRYILGVIQKNKVSVPYAMDLWNGYSLGLLSCRACQIPGIWDSDTNQSVLHALHVVQTHLPPPPSVSIPSLIVLVRMLFYVDSPTNGPSSDSKIYLEHIIDIKDDECDDNQLCSSTKIQRVETMWNLRWSLSLNTIWLLFSRKRCC